MRGEVDTCCSEAVSLPVFRRNVKLASAETFVSVSEAIFVTIGMSALPTEVGGVLTALLEAAGVDSVEDMVDEVDGLPECGGMAVGSALAEFLSGWLTGAPPIGVIPEILFWLALILPDLDDGLDNGCESNICTRLSCAGACR
jgi:hypothetical protein